MAADIATLERQVTRLQEVVDVLAGSRGNGENAAVRRSELNALARQSSGEAESESGAYMPLMPETLVDGSNMDDVVAPGLYITDANTVNSPSTEGAVGVSSDPPYWEHRWLITVHRYSDSVDDGVLQLARQISAPEPEEYMRSFAAGAWGPWQEIATLNKARSYGAIQADTVSATRTSTAYNWVSDALYYTRQSRAVSATKATIYVYGYTESAAAGTEDRCSFRFYALIDGAWTQMSAGLGVGGFRIDNPTAAARLQYFNMSYPLRLSPAQMADAEQWAVAVQGAVVVAGSSLTVLYVIVDFSETAG